MGMVAVVGYSLFGGLCLWRGLFHPHRAVVREGALRRCAGSNSFGVCDPSLQIVTLEGVSVYSTAPGKVVDIGDDYVHVLVKNENVILMYSGVYPTVRKGQHVSPGQTIGESSGEIFFSVTQFKSQNGQTVAQYVTPSGWLALRGAKPVVKNTGDPSLWCAGGREIAVPSSAKSKCDLKTPDKASFALLPVSVEMGEA